MRLKRRPYWTLILCLFFTSLAHSGNSGDKTLLVLGDSLSAAYGINEQQGWVELLRQRLALEGSRKSVNYQVVNASISGETSGGGLARLPALLQKHKPDILLLELGGNDGLRGHPLNLLKRNLNQIVSLSRAEGAEVLLLGIQIPPNYGGRYTKAFSSLYGELARQHQLPFVPFFLENVATRTEWMQADGIHPKAEAQHQLFKNVEPYLMPLL